MKNIKRIIFMCAYIFAVSLTLPQYAYAMHIAEGFLPMSWVGFWFALAAPFVYMGVRSINKIVGEKPELKMLLGLAGAFTFVLSALKIPSVTGSCSHPTGIGLGTILFGPMAMVVIGLIVLIFQALLLAHGGITTLGANTFSMAIVGSLVSFVLYRVGKKLGFPLWLAVFLSATLGDLATYISTSLQLALAFPAQNGGVLASMIKFMGVFAFTQVPLAISEGILSIVVINILTKYNKRELKELSVLSGEG
ncbi:MAG: energy-coupling factor ABC transporter permease [Bacillota bacterium]